MFLFPLKSHNEEKLSEVPLGFDAEEGGRGLYSVVPTFQPPSRPLL